MKLALIWLLSFAAFATANLREEPWIEEELEETHNDEEQKHERITREVVEEHEVPVRDKRCDIPERVRRSPTKSEDYVRRPRQVHQYEVHEVNEEAAHPSVPYEEMLAASAEHYHKVYAAPGTKSARYLNADVSRSPNTLGVRTVPSNQAQFAPAAKLVPFPHSPLSVANQPHSANYASNVAPGIVSVSGANGPSPIFIPAPQPTIQLSEDQFPAAGHHHQQQKHHHGHTQGGGLGHQAQHNNEHGVKATKGFKTDQYVDKGGKGFKKDVNHRKEYEEAAGANTKHHDHAGHKGTHAEEAHGHKGSNFEEKKGHKKGHKTKGYHNKYHKDEFHKEHKFYDDFHKSGEHHRYGKFNAKHAANESGKKKAHHVNAGHDFVERGKKGYSNKGHVDADHKGHNAKNGHEEHHENHSQYGKKGGKEGGSHWGHAKKN